MQHVTYWLFSLPENEDEGWNRGKSRRKWCHPFISTRRTLKSGAANGLRACVTHKASVSIKRPSVGGSRPSMPFFLYGYSRQLITVGMVGKDEQHIVRIPSEGEYWWFLNPLESITESFSSMVRNGEKQKQQLSHHFIFNCRVNIQTDGIIQVVARKYLLIHFRYHDTNNPIKEGKTIYRFKQRNLLLIALWRETQSWRAENVDGIFLFMREFPFFRLGNNKKKSWKYLGNVSCSVFERKKIIFYFYFIFKRKQERVVFFFFCLKYI